MIAVSSLLSLHAPCPRLSPRRFQAGHNYDGECSRAYVQCAGLVVELPSRCRGAGHASNARGRSFVLKLKLSLLGAPVLGLLTCVACGAEAPEKGATPPTTTET